MTNHVLPRMACGGAIFLFALAHCGCTSMNGWGTAWNSKPKPPVNPNDKETISYLGQKKPPNKPLSADELQARMDRERSNSDKTRSDTERSRLFTDQLRLAQQHLRDNRLDEAQKAYDRALAVRPDDPDCHHGMAVIADKRSQFDDADKHYIAALKQRPRDANLLSDYGYSLYLRGDDQRAEGKLNEALAINPKHKGAMANLGAIYQKQGRQDEALAMFRRGASEAEVQLYMGKLFPQSPSLGGGADDTVLAQNSNAGNPRIAPAMPTDDKEYSTEQLKGMTPQQVKEVMLRKRELAERKRNEQAMAELGRRDLPENSQPNSQLQSGFNRSVQQSGWNGNQNQPNSNASNQMPIVLPNGGNMPQSNPQYAANQGYGQNSNGYPPVQNGSLAAPPGANPEISIWESPRGQNSYQQPGTVPPPLNQPTQAGSTSGWNQPPQYANAQNNPPARRFAPAGLQSSVDSDPNLQFASSAQPAGENSISAAAAQLGMNAGPGGLFPVANTDDVTQTGFPPSNLPGSNSRFAHEFPTAPQFQNPNPPSGGTPGRDSAQGSLPYQNSPRIAPPSPSSDWGDFGPQTGAPPGGTSSNADGSPSDSNAGSNYRGSSSNWGNSMNPPAGSPLSGSPPYSGPWPGNGPSGQQPPNRFFGNNSGASSQGMWNQGGSGNAPQPRIIGPANPNASNGSTVERWPYAPQQ